jgi:hypothetical protein
MRNFISAFDKDESQRQKDRAQAIEGGVNGGQIVFWICAKGICCVWMV